jgi:hypothetical protein
MTATGSGGTATANGAGTGSHTTLIVNRCARFTGANSQQIFPTSDAGGVCAAHSTNDQMRMASPRSGDDGGLFSTNWWDFQNDPHGVDGTCTYLCPDWAFGGGHGGQELNGGGYNTVEGGPFEGGFTEWGVRCAITSTNCTNPSPLALGIPYLTSEFQRFGYQYPKFNGTADGSCGGSSCTHYPGSMDHAQTTPGNSSSLDLSTQPWFMDSASYSGISNDPSVSVTGNIRRYTSSRAFDRTVPFHYEDGVSFLTNISAPGSLLPNTGSGEVCVVFQAGECWAGSTVGQIYADLPGSPASSCQAIEAGISTTPDMCVGNMLVADNAITQFQLTAVGSSLGNDANGRPYYGFGAVRRLVTAWAGPLRFSETHDHVDPTGQWAFFESLMGNPNLLNAAFDYNSWIQTMMAKIPPPWTPDGVDRTQWESPTIAIGTVSGATYALLEYGYEENGPRTSLFCAQYTGTGTCVYSGTSTPVFSVASASSSCTGTAACKLTLSSNVTPPIGAPGHTMFYEILYFNGSNVQVGSSVISAVTIP